jgi:uncharacterized membrane protein HdeD (DUF308 family)
MSLRELSSSAVHVLGHMAMTLIGVVFFIVGLALTVTAVFTVPGVVLLCVGVALTVTGIWAHQLGAP